MKVGNDTLWALTGSESHITKNLADPGEKCEYSTELHEKLLKRFV